MCLSIGTALSELMSRVVTTAKQASTADPTTATRGYNSGMGRIEVCHLKFFDSEEKGRQEVAEESLDESLEAHEEAEEEEAEEGDEEDMFLVAAAVEDAGGYLGLGSPSPPPPPPPPG